MSFVKEFINYLVAIPVISLIYFTFSKVEYHFEYILRNNPQIKHSSWIDFIMDLKYLHFSYIMLPFYIPTEVTLDKTDDGIRRKIKRSIVGFWLSFAVVMLLTMMAN